MKNKRIAFMVAVVLLCGIVFSLTFLYGKNAGKQDTTKNAGTSNVKEAKSDMEPANGGDEAGNSLNAGGDDTSNAGGNVTGSDDASNAGGDAAGGDDASNAGSDDALNAGGDAAGSDDASNAGGDETGSDDASNAGGGADSSNAGKGNAAVETVSGKIPHNSTLNTGNLTEKGNGYEGTKGTGNFNYGEALQKSLLFYELQRSGDLPENVRCNWRGDSCLNDGADNGVDLSGGLFDAGDNVKFNLPMAYTGAVIGWSVYEDRDAYKESGQLIYALDTLKWISDYLIKCHTDDYVFYYQVGDGNQDHSWWGPAELVESQMERPSYFVTKENPGSCVVAEASAALATTALAFTDVDADYSKKCLEHAVSLFKFANETRSDAGYTAANGFYTSHSGFYDELSWAATWLYIATKDDSYLKIAKETYKSANQDSDWALCWDDVHIGAAVLLAKLTGEDTYKNAVEKHLDWWTTGLKTGERVTYSPKGLAVLDQWGALRYATTTGFVAGVYSEWEGCSKQKQSTYWNFAVSQADYALGSTGFSYMIGFGDNYPEHPHHRTAQGSASNNMNDPEVSKHTLYGALVGGPDASDGYTDTVTDYCKNEVACDYNAGFTGLLAKLYSKYKGQTIKDFGAVEEVPDEYYIEGGINVDGEDFIEIKANVFNATGWPARAAEDVELRYFMDLSEVIDAGGTTGNIVVTTNYMQGGSVDGLYTWDADKNLYYLSVKFGDGTLYPGGQEHYKQEIQVRIRDDLGIWDDTNDYSFEGLKLGSTARAENMALYENGKLIFGSEPKSGKDAGKKADAAAGSLNNGGKGGNGNNGNGNGGNNGNNGNGNAAIGGASVGTKNAEGENFSVTVRYDGTSASSSAITGIMEIKNIGSENYPLKKLSIEYYFTKDGKSDFLFDCYHAAINGANGAYSGLNSVTGKYSAFKAAKNKDADTKLTISFGDDATLNANDTLSVNFSIHSSDWGAINTTNDYSVADAANIVVKSDSKVIFGNEPK